MKIFLPLIFCFFSLNFLQAQNFRPAALNPFGMNTSITEYYAGFLIEDIDGDLDFDLMWEDEDSGDTWVILNDGSVGNPDFTNSPAEDFLVFDNGISLGQGLFSITPTSLLMDMDLDGDLDHLGTISSDDYDLGPSEFYINENLLVEADTLFVFNEVPIFGSEFNLPDLPFFTIESIAAVDIDGDSDLDIFGVRGDEETYNVDFMFYESLYSTGVPEFTGEELKNGYGFVPQDEIAFGFPTFIDIDLDADQDLLISSFTGDWHLYENLGTPTEPNFDPNRQINPYGLTKLPEYGFPHALDVDADGFTDIMVASAGSVYYFEFAQTSSTKEHSLHETINIAGNPSNGLIEISSDMDQIEKITISSWDGKEIFAQSINSQTTQININSKVNGMLYARIKLKTQEQPIIKKIFLQN